MADNYSGSPPKKKPNQESVEYPRKRKPEDENSYSDVELLQKSSAGVSLCGVLLSGKYEDMVQSREQVLAIPQKLTPLKQTCAVVSQKYETFVSRVSEERFEKGIFTLGVSATMSQINVFKVQQQFCQNYVCATNYTGVVKKALQLSHMCLSPNIICKLKAIENKVEEGSVTESIRAIFQQFGSHVLKGPVQFGGMFKFSSTVVGFPDSKAEEARRCVEDDLEAFCGEHSQARHHDLSVQNVQFEKSTYAVRRNIVKKGGLCESHNFKSWQEGLDNSSSTWQVVDRGDEFIPIWDILRHQHQDDFTNHHKVCNLLITVYKVMASELDMQTLQSITNVMETEEELESASIDQVQLRASSMEEDIDVDPKKILFDIKKRLGLPTKSKLQMSDVVCVNHLLNTSSENIEEKDAAMWYLNKLIKLDYKNMYAFYKADQPRAEPHSAPKPDDFWEDDINQEDLEAASNIHQSDILVAILLSSSIVVQQFIFTKLAMCQLALPIVIGYPDEQMFYLWASRNISRTWKTNPQGTQKAISHEERMAVCKTHIVSFVRLGSHALINKSKSNILNHILYNQEHNVFLDRFCNKYKHTRKLAEGMVELAWYHPTVDDNDGPFDQTLTFLNLRGDGNEHASNLDFVIQAANIIVFFGAKKEMETFDAQIGKYDNKKIIYVTEETDRHKRMADKIKLGIKGDMEIQISSKIIREVNYLLQQLNKQKGSEISLEGLQEIALKCNIQVDEDNPDCRIPKEKAQELIPMLHGRNVSEFKEKFLPLHRKMWEKWCVLDKKLHNLQAEHGKSQDQLRIEIENEKRNCREYQRKKKISAFIEKFYKALFDLKPSRHITYLNWVAYYLEFETKQKIMKLTDEYRYLCHKSSGTEESKEKISVVDDQLIDSSLGLEHIFREINQFYTAVLETEYDENTEHLSVLDLPCIVADLVIAGQPFELMDGDVSHISLKWINAVLEEISKKLRNPKIFVVSVLGVQSTGKSTLLNTMFGLQFAVSSGRCTRGAFMQLLHIDKELHGQLGYEYMMVVDTEGLKSSEIAKLSSSSEHDNRLTTFIIGLGDVTIINIFGESVSDMEDLLQIAVQAFIRMGEVNISPSAFFLHQNVSAVNAEGKNFKARRKLKDRLDEMTSIAVKEEGTAVQYNCFNDVIKFNDQSVEYISGLLKGDPPMAPPNPGYSLKVHKVQQRLVKIKGQKKRIDDFIPRVNDLWAALQSENFVFSFKNTYEISVYTKVEKVYTNSRATLYMAKLDLEQRKCTAISNAEILHENLLYEINAEINKVMEDTYENICIDLEKLFEQDEDKVTLQKWKFETEGDLQKLNIQLQEEARATCKEYFDNKKTRKNVENQKQEYKKKIIKRARDLAKILKGTTVDEEQLKQEFEDNIWRHVYNEVSAGSSQKHVDIAADAEYVLNKHFKSYPADLRKPISAKNLRNGNYKKLSFNVEQHMVDRSKWDKLKQYIPFLKPEQPKQFVDQLLETITEKLNLYFIEKLNTKTNYSVMLFYKIIDLMQLQLKNKQSRKDIQSDVTMFQKRFQVDLALHLFTIAIDAFTDMRHLYIQETCPKVYLQRKKTGYYKTFKRFFDGAEACSIAVDTFLIDFPDVVEVAARERIGTAIGNHLNYTHRAFKENRANLEKYILKALAEKKEFEAIKTYILYPKQAFSDFVREEINKWCTQISDGKPDLDIWIDKEYQRLEKVVVTAISDTNSNEGISEWTKSFLEKSVIKEQLKNISKCFEGIEDTGIDADDISLFSTELTNRIPEVFRCLIEKVKTEGLGHLTDKNTHPATIIKNRLEGCWRQCPFCGSLCTNAKENHSGLHARELHRPTGLYGLHDRDTKKLSFGICTSRVASNYVFYHGDDKRTPYSEYPKAGEPYSTWQITYDSSEQAYWERMICKFQTDIEEMWHKKFEVIQASWHKITQTQAIQELKMPI